MKAIKRIPEILYALCSTALFLPVLVFLFVSQSYAETAAGNEEVLISQIINAYGGRETLAKVHSISADGRIRKLFPNEEGSYSRYMKRERKLVVNISYSRSSEKRILNGKKGYRGVNGQSEPVKGPPYDAMVYQYNQIDLPFGFLDGAFKIIAVRKDRLNGSDVDVLRLKDKGGYELDIYVSSKDFLILKSIGYFNIGKSQSNLGAEFRDFRKVDGIVLPFKIINYARGSKLSETEITKYQINPPIDDSVFNP